MKKLHEELNELFDFLEEDTIDTDKYEQLYYDEEPCQVVTDIMEQHNVKEYSYDEVNINGDGMEYTFILKYVIDGKEFERKGYYCY